MPQFPPQESPSGYSNSSYCLNPNCQNPENLRSADICSNCGSQLLLVGRYRALKLIGAGGFGRTFLAIDESQPYKPRCAIKQFVPQSSRREKASELFRQEAHRLQEIGSHPQIPYLLGYFEQDGQQYLVQQWIGGRNLARELAEEGPFNETKIRQLLNDLLPVLWFVHNHQMIHRDIKPENIIRRARGGELVLVDFGAAKLATETALAKTGTVIGSAAYTAPEQTKGKAIFASDIYSLGVTCIHLMTQVPPFDLFDTSVDKWVWRQYLQTPPSPQLGRVLDKMLQSATKQRYQSAPEVLNDLNNRSSLSAFSNRKILAGSAVLVLALAGITWVNSVKHPPVQTYLNPPPEETTEKQSPANIGGLFAKIAGKEQIFPLQHTQVSAKVAGNVSRVEVTQTFANPYKQPLEAIYKFPLPEDAAVDDMEIQIGDRVIRGLIKKREEAQKIYEAAKQSGKTAGLLEQERDNIFTQSLANIQPGEKINVTIRYTNSLKFEGGDYEFVLPMVVGERYIPGSPVNAWGDTNLVPDASKLNPGSLPAGMRSGRDIGVTVDIDAGMPISQVISPSHAIALSSDSSTVRVKLKNPEFIPNQDLILRYKVAGASTQATVLTQQDERGGHFAVYLIPAVQYNPEEIVPKDVVFLIDTSGSQSGEPIEQSRELMRQFVSGLNPDDTFSIIDFANTATQLSPAPLPNTPANRDRAIAYINSLDANGGTELMHGINTVLNYPHAPNGRLRSIVLITDGLIGNDEQIISQVKNKLQPGNRLYSFGVGPSTNRFLVERLAEIGRGTAEVLPPTEPAGKVAEKFFREINNPVLTNIEVTWVGSGKAVEIYPLQSPDLFANQPLVLFGRKSDRKSGQLRISGTVAGGGRYEKTLNVNFSQVSGNGAIGQLWARARIKELMNQMYGSETPLGIQEVTKTALAYRLMSKYTAFVAVLEEARVGKKNPARQVSVSVETPEETPSATPSYRSGYSDSSVPEPSGILSSILAILWLGVYFVWKQLRADRDISPLK